jgi:hypothetical protein
MRRRRGPPRRRRLRVDRGLAGRRRGRRGHQHRRCPVGLRRSLPGHRHRNRRRRRMHAAGHRAGVRDSSLLQRPSLRRRVRRDIAGQERMSLRGYLRWCLGRMLRTVRLLQRRRRRLPDSRDLQSRSLTQRSTRSAARRACGHGHSLLRRSTETTPVARVDADQRVELSGNHVREFIAASCIAFSISWRKFIRAQYRDESRDCHQARSTNARSGTSSHTDRPSRSRRSDRRRWSPAECCYRAPLLMS